MNWRKSRHSIGDGNCVEVAEDWRKSTFSFSNGACVEVAADFRKSSLSMANGNCVEAGTFRKSSLSMSNGACAEIGTAPGGVLVRDTADRGGPVLAVTGPAWTAFLATVRGGAAWT